MSTNRQGDWIQTATGKQFWPFDPRPEDIDIVDIAISLSKQCRFGGHCKDGAFISVAQHSVEVSLHVPEKDALWGLLHDAPEAYLGDLKRPIKKHPKFAFYRELEKAIMDCMCERFGLLKECPASVHLADEYALATERRDFMASSPEPWENMLSPWDDIQVSWSPDKASWRFMDRFNELIGAYEPWPSSCK